MKSTEKAVGGWLSKNLRSNGNYSTMQTFIVPQRGRTLSIQVIVHSDGFCMLMLCKLSKCLVSQQHWHEHSTLFSWLNAEWGEKSTVRYLWTCNASVGHMLITERYLNDVLQIEITLDGVNGNGQDLISWTYFPCPFFFWNIDSQTFCSLIYLTWKENLDVVPYRTSGV